MRSSLHFSQPPARQLNPAPTRRWDRPASRQNPNPQPPVRRLIQGPLGPGSKMGATSRLRKSHLSTACAAVRMSGPAWRRRKRALRSIFLSRLRGGSNRARRGDGIDRRTGKTQILNRLFGGSSRAPWGPGSKMGATAAAEIPSCDRLCGGSHVGPGMEETQARSSLHFLSRLHGGSNRARRGDGIDRRTGKTQILNRLFGGSSRVPWGPGPKMGATAACGNPILRPPMRRLALLPFLRWCIGR